MGFWKKRGHACALLTFVFVVAFFFANVEIQIEGDAGWASSLPTWRVESHPLLDVFWGGRPLTGYHAWVFSFMALVFHLPLFLTGTYSRKLHARVFACLMFFWIVEDFLWFVLNPAFGIGRFSPGHVSWHKHWALFLPTDYWLFALIGGGLYWYSFRREQPSVRRQPESC